MENIALHSGLDIFYPVNTSFFFQSLVLMFFGYLIFKNFIKQVKFDENLFVFISFICVAVVLGFNSVPTEFMNESISFIMKKILLFILMFVVFYLWLKFYKKDDEKIVKKESKKKY